MCTTSVLGPHTLASNRLLLARYCRTSLLKAGSRDKRTDGHLAAAHVRLFPSRDGRATRPGERPLGYISRLDLSRSVLQCRTQSHRFTRYKRLLLQSCGGQLVRLWVTGKRPGALWLLIVYYVCRPGSNIVMFLCVGSTGGVEERVCS